MEIAIAIAIAAVLVAGMAHDAFRRYLDRHNTDELAELRADFEQYKLDNGAAYTELNNKVKQLGNRQPAARRLTGIGR